MRQFRLIWAKGAQVRNGEAIDEVAVFDSIDEWMLPVHIYEKKGEEYELIMTMSKLADNMTIDEIMRM